MVSFPKDGALCALFELFTPSRLLGLLEFKNSRYTLTGNPLSQHFETGCFVNVQIKEIQREQLTVLLCNKTGLLSNSRTQRGIHQSCRFPRFPPRPSPALADKCLLISVDQFAVTSSAKPSQLPHAKLVTSLPMLLHSWEHTSLSTLNSAYRDLPASPIRLWTTSGQMVSPSSRFPSI